MANTLGFHFAPGSRGRSGLEEVGMKQFSRSHLQYSVTSAPRWYLPILYADFFPLSGTV